MTQARGILCRLGISVAVVFFLLYPTTAFSAADIAVSNGGADNGTCGGGASPCKTIGYAVGTRAASGDTFKPAAGTYNAETFPIRLVNGVSIIGDVTTPANVVVNAGGLSTVFLTNGPLSSSTVISGLSIEPGGTSTSNTGLRIDANTGVAITAVIEDNRFVGGGRGINALNDMGGIGVNLSPTIRLNSFSSQRWEAIHFEMTDSGSGQFMSPVITGNTITNARAGISMGVTDSAEGVISPLIASNTIVSPIEAGVVLYVTSLGGNPDASITFSPTIRNNTITGPEGSAIEVTLAGVYDSNAVIKFNPTINSNTITGTSGYDGIDVAIVYFGEEVTSLSLSGNITINNNTISGMGYEGIQLYVADLSSMTNGKAVIAATISGNTVTDNGGAGINAEAIYIDSSVAGFKFSPTVKNNTVSGNGSFGSGIDIAYTDSGAGGTALVSGNQVINNNGTGVSIEIRNQNYDGKFISPVPAKVALRNNTISGNGGDAIKVFGGSTDPGDVVKAVGGSMSLVFERPAAGNYAVDLGGFLTGDGKNVILGNTGKGFFDIDNDGPNDVAAQCNDFTAADVTAEEAFLNDHDDDPARGDVHPISICQPKACTKDSDCDDTDPTTCDVCNPATHLCVHYSEGGCNDFNSCTTDDQCTAGVCAGTAVANGTSCDDGKLCTVSDKCTGGVCAGTPGNAGAVCRPAANDCDVVETCTGTDANCPPDQAAPDETPCDDGKLCTVNDMCTGGVCAGTPGNAGTVCRPAANDCDVEETCTGTDADCPPDAHVPDKTSCDDGHACTVDDTCTGGVCAGTLAGAGVICRPVNGGCDIAETCDGTDPDCPADEFLAAGTLCRAAANGCDVPEECTGTSASCPTDVVQPNGTVCTAVGNPCSVGTCKGDGVAFVGFTAATGAFSESHAIVSWTFGSTVNYADFSSVAGLTLVGNAAQAGTLLRLTPDMTSQRGAAWFNTRQSVQGGFDTTFQFQISASSEVKADGLAFVIQNDPAGTSAIGDGGGGIGYASIPNSLAVEFDTYNNGEFTTPHVSVQTRGTAPNSRYDSASLGHLAFPSMADGNVHTARITYVPGTMDIFIDGAATPGLSVAVDLASLGLTLANSACIDQAPGNAGVECRAAVGACDAPEVCDGTHLTCPADVNRPDGFPCPDATVCNGAETCQAGACTAGTPLDCNDFSKCTTDTCDAVTGCVHTPVPGCDDGDGVPSGVEDGAPNSGDGNNDGVPDRAQRFVASFPASSGRGYVTIVLSSNDPDPGCHQLLNVSAASPASLGQDPGFTYPFGMVSFQVNCASSVTVTFIMHGAMELTSSMTYRKFGPMAPNFAGPARFYTLPGVVYGTMNIPGEGTVRTATFTLTDQRLGDGSGVVGTIVDPSGPAISSSQGVAPVMSFGGLVALAALLGMVAWFGLRHRGRGIEPST